MNEEGENNFLSLLEGAFIILWKFDTSNDKITFWEGKLQHQVVPPPHKGANVYDHFKDYPELIDVIRNTRHGLDKKLHEFKIQEFHFEFSFVGKGAEVISTITDVTSRKEMEHERNLLHVREQSAISASALKSEFLRNVSHEIRTPISAILGIASLLKDTHLDTEQADFLNMLVYSGSNLIVLIDDILDFSKIEANKIVLEHIDFDFMDLLNMTYHTYKVVAHEKQISFRFENALNLEVMWIKGDPNRIRQIISNLLNNAFKFTSSGEIVLGLQKATNKMMIKVDVKDTGIGVSEETQAKLFTAFVQANISTTKQYGGSGLGLSICKRLIHLIGGDIGIKSKLNEGSTFWIEFPYIVGTEPAAIAPPPRVAGSEKALLIAEDNFINRRVLLKHLSQLGYTNTVGVENGRDALNSIIENPGKYSLLISDIMMPVMDGYELARLIRLLPNDDSKMHICAMTANAMRGEKKLCLDTGMDDYLSKPVDRYVLAEMLQRVL